MSAAEPIEQLLQRRLLIVIGKGGVGRTSVSAALAVMANQRGARVLIIEAELRAPIAAAYGKRAGFEPVELQPRLYAMALRGQESLEEYLSFVVPKRILRMVFGTSLYQYFVQAAPAVRELTMMGKVFHEVERRAPSLPPWDLVIFDTPASGQALSMIRMPFAAGETFGEGMVGHEAAAIGQLLHDQAKCAIVAVTTAEPLALKETLQIYRALRKLDLATAAVFFNRISAAAFDNAAIGRMMRRYGGAGWIDGLDKLARIARAELKRRTRERRALTLLRRGIACPVLTITEHGEPAGKALFEALSGQLDRPDCSTPASVPRQS
ncbi:MAG TPA: ArsA family ATPase [Candidatus Binataceae bacterium]|nr:ArsA family ATPase [Candidatus Binataceae bacterium]